jgi:hypothetical protein
MSAIVDLMAWRSARATQDGNSGASGSQPGTLLAYRPVGERRGDDVGDGSLPRLERAVDRLYELVSQALQASGRLTPRVETEMLAILGELAMDCVDDAAIRAERLVRGLTVRSRAKEGNGRR